MYRDYDRITEDILKKRDAYYKRRKKIINSVIYSVIPIFIISISLLLFPPKNKNEAPKIEYDYMYMMVEVSKTTQYQNFVINDIQLVNEVMDYIEESCEYTNDLPENDKNPEYNGSINEDEILPSTDYLLRVVDKNGNNLLFIITRNYILAENGKAYSLTTNKFNYIESLLEDKWKSHRLNSSGDFSLFLVVREYGNFR